MALLPFAQLELPGSLPLPDGRYLSRAHGGSGAEGDGEDDVDVLAVRTLGAPRAPGGRRRRRTSPVEPEPSPIPLQLARVTLIKARPFSGEEAARRWLDSAAGDEQLATALVGELVGTLNRALLAFRVAAPDPFCGPVDPESTLVTRFGYGSGEEVADGRWREARALPERRRAGARRRAIDSVGASERIAAVLGAREEVSTAESLLSRAGAALVEGRFDEAALLAGTAAEAALRDEELTRAEAEQPLALRERALAGTGPGEDALRAALRGLRRALSLAHADSGPA